MEVFESLGEIIPLPAQTVADATQIAFNEVGLITTTKEVTPESVSCVDPPGDGKPRRASGMGMAIGGGADWKRLGRSGASQFWNQVIPSTKFAFGVSSTQW